MLGFYDKTTVRELMKECSKMYKFDHPNVLTLKGVCLDGGPAPFIIMPFMANGSLINYLHKKRDSLVITKGDEDDEVVSQSTQGSPRFKYGLSVAMCIHLRLFKTRKPFA